jgi:hypothetical protein
LGWDGARTIARGPVFQVQLFLQSSLPLTPEQRQQAEAMFLELSGIVRADFFARENG